jgi:hypothetical protein
MSEQELSFNLTLNDTNTVLAGLSELPAKQSYDLINKLKVQAQTQLEPAPQVEQAAAPAPQLLTETTPQ